MEEPEIQELLKKVYEHGCKNVIATMGGRGQIFYNGSEFIKGKVYFVEPVDTMGAGDSYLCLLYTSDAADEEDSVDLGGRRIIKKKKKVILQQGSI